MTVSLLPSSPSTGGVASSIGASFPLQLSQKDAWEPYTQGPLSFVAVGEYTQLVFEANSGSCVRVDDVVITTEVEKAEADAAT